MSKSSVQKVLSSPTKLVEQTAMTPNGLIAQVWRKMLYEIGMSPSKWHVMVEKYLDEEEQIPRQGATAKDNYQRGKVRNSLNTELFKDEITFNTFIRGLKIIKYDTLSIEFNASKYHNEVNGSVRVALNYETLLAIMEAQGTYTNNTKTKEE